MRKCPSWVTPAKTGVRTSTMSSPIAAVRRFRINVLYNNARFTVVRAERPFKCPALRMD
jgi:hypothetical protein